MYHHDIHFQVSQFLFSFLILGFANIVLLFFIAISIAVDPLSEKNTLFIEGEIFISFFARVSEGSFVKLNNGEC